MLQYLKRAQRDAELLARLGVFQRRGIQFSHRPDGFGAKRGNGAVAAGLQSRDGLPFLAQYPACRNPHIPEGGFRGASTIDPLETLQVTTYPLPGPPEHADPPT